MQVFVIGSKGYLGAAAVARLAAAGIAVRAVSSRPNAGMLQLDLVRAAEFAYDEVGSGDLVLMTAANSSPDFCRTQPELARDINVEGTGFFIERCLERGARVVFFSSDTVYGPGEDERSEDAICHPAGEYAAMKREVESRFAQHDAFKVLRLSYVFSRHDKFTSYLVACARDGREAELFHPMLRRCVYLGDLLDLLQLFCRPGQQVPDSIVNVCGPELLSRVDLAELFQTRVSAVLRYRIIDPPLGFFEARPQVINMSDATFSRLLGRRPTSISGAMQAEFINQEGIS
ncbi:MAG: NAD-dependent epimerase/dehydratase family protein [Deltaproteobacteria bacterium]|nr:NAD-dependent epimerase/dehydratase family protein [Deltaproteobacteria bacterium]TLN02259.1 MAG: sugar nucleotide-binding protein [bacterium]